MHFFMQKKLIALTVLTCSAALTGCKKSDDSSSSKPKFLKLESMILNGEKVPDQNRPWMVIQTADTSLCALPMGPGSGSLPYYWSTNGASEIELVKNYYGFYIPDASIQGTSSTEGDKIILNLNVENDLASYIFTPDTDGEVAKFLQERSNGVCKLAI